MCSTNPSFANNYLPNETLFLGLLIHKRAEPSSSFQSVLHAKDVCAEWKKKQTLCWGEMMTSRWDGAWRHYFNSIFSPHFKKCGEDIHFCPFSKMWRKYTYKIAVFFVHLTSRRTEMWWKIYKTAVFSTFGNYYKIARWLAS